MSMKQHEVEDALCFKEKYLVLFKNIYHIFVKWGEKNKNYYFSPQEDGCPWTSLQDPVEMVHIMDKYMETSTNEKMQKYLRKIMVSANLLLRKYFPEHNKEKFNIEKIYEKIS